MEHREHDLEDFWQMYTVLQQSWVRKFLNQIKTKTTEKKNIYDTQWFSH